MSEEEQVLHVTWTKSAIGYAKNQKRTVQALGLRRLHQTVEHPDSAALRGMVATVQHLVTVERGPRTEAARTRRGSRSAR